MERQATYDLLRCFLEKWSTQGIDCKKELPGLLAYGVAKGCFSDPNLVFEHEEWRRFGDKLFDEVVDDDSKAARKLLKQWRAVSNALLQHKAEQKAAAAALERLGAVAGAKAPSPDSSDYPLPPAVRTIRVPLEVMGGWGPQAPPCSAEPSTPPMESVEDVKVKESDMKVAGSVCGDEMREEGKRDRDPFRGGHDQQLVKERLMRWQQIADDAMAQGEMEFATKIAQGAFPVDAQGNPSAQLMNLDWKLLTQLRSTVNESGLKGEPTRQMLDYIWGTNILLPGDIRSIIKLVLTQHQQLLFNAHWQSLCQEAVAVVRQPGDPLHGLTLDELLGLGAYFRPEAQATMGPDRAREGMKLARQALDRIREPGGIPSYMGIKQGREEPFGLFIDRVASAIQAAGVSDYLKGTILKQCAIQNSNPATRNILATLPGTWTIEEGLERMAQVPVGPQAMLVEAVKELGNSLKQHAQATQSQVLAALALLGGPGRQDSRSLFRCRRFRCGVTGHMRKDCNAPPVWCRSCRSDTHNEAACRRSTSGNGRPSGKSRPALTQKAAAYPAALNPFLPSDPLHSDPPQAEASGWTWQHQ
ncbi:GAK7 protein, partial [Crotophaga sulcirostris]|nr:GAK7 protein [Crotophaga sulcirostris]